MWDVLAEYVSMFPDHSVDVINAHFASEYWCTFDKWIIKDCKYDIKVGRKTISKFQQWRQESEIDEITQELDKLIEKIQKKWVNISINYNAEVNKHTPIRIEPFVWWDVNNILVIPDIHTPATLDWFLEFVRKQQEIFNCWTVIYIWDIIDFHSLSYHEKIPELLNPKWEIAEAISVLQDWYYTFPEATVLMGNHDSIILRQARTAWLPRDFIKDLNKIFQAPAWYKFIDECIVHGVLYTHWTNWDAYAKCIGEWMNIVQWHLHTKWFVQYHRNRQWQKFGMQVWTWIDYKRNNFDYAKTNSKHPVLSCWVVLNSWKLPIIIPYS